VINPTWATFSAWLPKNAKYLKKKKYHGSYGNPTELADGEI